jgi:hypothetical protein
MTLAAEMASIIETTSATKTTLVAEKDLATELASAIETASTTETTSAHTRKSVPQDEAQVKILDGSSSLSSWGGYCTTETKPQWKGFVKTPKKI